MKYTTERRKVAAVKAMRDHFCETCKKTLRINRGAFQTHRRWCGVDKAARFWARIVKTPAGCWEHQGWGIITLT